MESAIVVLRWIHIAAGFGAFFIAIVPLVALKGGKAHRFWGKVYFWLMAVVTVTALILALYRPMIFLALIALFSFYFAFRGYRAILRKRLPQPGPQLIDWAGSLIALSASLVLLLLGVLRLGPVAILFGLFGSGMAGLDLWEFRHPPADKNRWWYAHMGGMVGSYIAAVSAFSVVNFEFLPSIARWLWPSAIGVPLLLIWILRYQRKFSANKKPTQVEV